MEEWRDIKGYEGLYQVSSIGNVRSTKRAGTQGKYIKPRIDNDGYNCVRLSKNGVMKNHFVHRLVAIAFIENENAYPCVNHKDENKSNNVVSNLEWCSVAYNNTYNDIHKRKIITRQRNRRLRLAGE